MEHWKAVKGFEGWYEVSNQGKIRSLDRVVEDVISPCERYPNGHVRSRNMKGKEIKINPVNEKGHGSLTLHKGKGKTKRVLIHRIIAEAFIPNPDKKPLVDHIDGDPTNNTADNLRWASYYENNNNTPYTRYLRELLEENEIKYLKEKEYYEANNKGSG